MTAPSHDPAGRQAPATPGGAAPAPRTLDDVDPPTWEPAPSDASTLVRRAHALRTVPLADLTVEDLRLLIGQAIALPTLVPMALGMLRSDPLTEGDYYPGDLLAAVMRAPDAHWRAHPEQLGVLRERLSQLDRGDPRYPAFDDELDKAVTRLIRD